MLRRWGIPPAQVRLLADHEATRAGVLAAWQEHLLANAAPDHHLWFHYSGHGSQSPSIDPDEADGMDETMVLYDSRTRGSSDLLDKEMAYLILQAEMAGAQVTVVLDCCHSGSGTRSGDQPAVRRCAAMTRLTTRPWPPRWLRTRICWRLPPRPPAIFCSRGPATTSWPTKSVCRRPAAGRGR
jgi:hypothetical protein